MLCYVFLQDFEITVSKPPNPVKAKGRFDCKVTFNFTLLQLTLALIQFYCSQVSFIQVFLDEQKGKATPAFCGAAMLKIPVLFPW